MGLRTSSSIGEVAGVRQWVVAPSGGMGEGNRVAMGQMKTVSACPHLPSLPPNVQLGSRDTPLDIWDPLAMPPSNPCQTEWVHELYVCHTGLYHGASLTIKKIPALMHVVADLMEVQLPAQKTEKSCPGP